MCLEVAPPTPPLQKKEKKNLSSECVIIQPNALGVSI